MEQQEIVVLVTASTEEEAAKIGRSLVDSGLAACANLIPRVRSIFRWEGAIAEEQECLMILKSRAELFEELASSVKKLHSYTVPEIIALPIVLGSVEYLAWMREVTVKSGGLHGGMENQKKVDHLPSDG
jgi:periplasmic divalent cation tolerance protein